MLRTTISIVGVFLAGGIFFLYTQPTYDKSSALQAQIAEYDQALQKAAELQQLKQQLLSRYNAFDPADIEKLHKLLPDHVDNIRLILDMDAMAAARRMSLSNVDISGNSSLPAAGTQKTVIGQIGADNRKFESLNVSFSTSGTYTNFKSFLDDLEKSLRIVDLTSLSIAAGGATQVAIPGAAPEPTYTYGLTLKTYWLK